MNNFARMHNEYLTPPEDPPEYCAVCGATDLDKCICPECHECGAQGDERCYQTDMFYRHGLIRTQAQCDGKQAFNDMLAKQIEDDRALCQAEYEHHQKYGHIDIDQDVPQ